MDKKTTLEEALQPLVDVAEENGWSCELAGDNSVSFETWSPAGEDICFESCVQFDGTNLFEVIADIIETLKGFDVDDHVAMWVPLRGTRGCPSSIAVLVHDAEAIETMCENLAIKIAGLCAGKN